MTQSGARAQSESDRSLVSIQGSLGSFLWQKLCQIGPNGETVTGSQLIAALGFSLWGSAASIASVLPLGGALGGGAASWAGRAAARQSFGFGGTGFTVNPVAILRTRAIVNRAREAGIAVQQPLWGMNADLVRRQPTVFVSWFASPTVAIEEYLHARNLQFLGAVRGELLIRNTILNYQHEVRLKALMIGAGRKGTLGSGPLKVDIDWLIKTRLDYLARLQAELGRRPF